MKCQTCYGKGYYVLTLLREDDYEVVWCECQISSDLSCQVLSNLGSVAVGDNPK